MSCNYVSQDIMDNIKAQEECNRLNLYSQKEYRIALPNIEWKSLTNDSIIWIGQDQAKNGGNLFKDDENHESTTISDNLSIYCQAWSLRRDEYQSVPCDTQLSVLCQADLVGKLE